MKREHAEQLVKAALESLGAPEDKTFLIKLTGELVKDIQKRLEKYQLDFAPQKDFTWLREILTKWLTEDTGIIPQE
jgi:hypothetical protein